MNHVSSSTPMLSGMRVLASGGMAGELMRNINWTDTPVGHQDSWPISLKLAVRILLDCKLPMYIAWGDEFVQFYNDAYAPILGNKHPAAMGSGVRQTWPEIWDTIGPMWAEVIQGRSIGFDDYKLTIERFGYPEDVYFDFSYSPVPDDQGNPAGVLVTYSETTEKVKTAKKLQALNEKLEIALQEQRTAREALTLSEERLQFALAGAGDGVWDWNIDRGEVFYSSRWKEILGIDGDQIDCIFETFQNLIHASDLAHFSDRIEACRDGSADSLAIELRMWHRQSKWVWIAIRAKVVSRNEEGKGLRVSGTITDVTDFQSLNLEFKRKTLMLENLANEVPGAIYQFKMGADRSFSCPYISKAVTDIFELSAEEFMLDVQLAFARIHPEDLPPLMNLISHSAETLDRADTELRLLLPKKGLRLVEVRSKPSRLEDGAIIWHGFVTDITAIRAENKPSHPAPSNA